MACEVDSFHDAMYKIVPLLNASVFEANIKALEKVAHIVPYLAAIPKQIRRGFDFGIKDLHEIALEPHWFRVQTERIKRCNSQAKKDY
ncbi:BQ5605_C006g04091 [Microbotryum silenes-dioicae]|uniref:BQ5605_C006g04091 protein n=1 Tax=Microbotryum silenes-dioicae TaxID=796604 RepID=A0A2X0P8C6_9BASI|nr:BQ5605_C006g04091 [Microbotryum silenes-dioicae]